MPSLHLIQNQTDPKLLPRLEQPGSDMWISGYWSLAEATVEFLVGGRVYFHKAQAKPAFFAANYWVIARRPMSRPFRAPYLTIPQPRALPWAGMFRTVGAEDERRNQKP